MHLKKSWKYGVRVLGITLLTFLLSHFLIYDISSISYFAPMEKASDFSVSDFYQLVANRKDIRRLEENIVIVSIDSCGRKEISELIEAIDFCNPAAIGLDVFFNYSTTDDSLLIEAIESSDRLILPCSVQYDIESNKCTAVSGSFFDKQLKRKKIFAAVNLAGNTIQSVIREFRPFFVYEGDTIPHFATALLHMADEAAYNRLKQRGNDMEIINYPLNDFSILSPHEVLCFPEELEGKIVLIGSIHEQWDCHVTPVSAQMPGILIHAHSIATMLQAAYIHEIADWIVWGIAIALCIGVLLIQDTCEGSKYESLFMRIVQLMILYFIIVIGYYFYSKQQLSIDFAIPLLMVGLEFLARDIWAGGVDLFHTIKEKFTHLKNDKL